MSAAIPPDPASTVVDGSIVAPTPEAIARAAEAIAQGRLVGMPTETVYGLAADATDPRAVAAVFEAKGRPRFNPLIAHVASLDDARREAAFEPLALRLAEAFWPGPLTIVAPRRADGRVCDLACAGLSTVAVRVPAHPVARALIEAAGRPIAAPSANVSGRPSPTTAAHVAEAFADAVACVLDGGPAHVGIESAVVAVAGGRATLLRLGGLARAEIEAVAGPLLSPGAADRAAPASPGMVLRHYAPTAPVRLDAERAEAGEVLIGFGAPRPGESFNLSPTEDLAEAAANLFSMLRAADARAPAAIAVAPVPPTGLGEAILDRLTRAARG